MKLRDVIALLEKVLPSFLIEEGDNCGLLIGDMNAEVNHIRTALEVSDEVLDQAVKDGVDLLIVHHPMIYSPLKNITSETLRGRKALRMIQSGMGLYAAHSNLDRTMGGLNQRFGASIGFEDVKAMDEDGFILLGRVNEPVRLDDYTNQLSRILGSTQVRFVGDPGKMIEKVAFCTGSGVGLLYDELFTQADVYLTGDLKYHDAMDIHEKHQAIIDVTHFASEAMAAEVLYDLVTSVIDSIRVSVDKSIVNPIRQ